MQNKIAQISAIIEKRRPVVNRIEAVELHLKTLSEALSALQDQCAMQREKSEEVEVCDRLDQVNNSPLQSLVPVIHQFILENLTTDAFA